MQIFSMEAVKLEDCLNSSELTLCTNMCTLLSTTELEKADYMKDVDEAGKEKLAAEIMQAFKKQIPTQLQKVPFQRQDNFIAEVSALMQEAGNAYPAQMTITFVMNGIKALSVLDEENFAQRITKTKSAIQISSIQQPGDFRFVEHTLCLNNEFVEMFF